MATLIHPDGWQVESENLDSELENRTSKDAMSKDGMCMLQPGDALWVPFGWSCVTYGLIASRPTITEASEINQAKKASSTSKKGQANAKKGREFCKLLWLPCWSPERDVQGEAKLVGRQYETMVSAQKFLTAGVVGHASWKDYMEALKTKSDALSKESVQKSASGKKAANLKRRDSEHSATSQK